MLNVIYMRPVKRIFCLGLILKCLLLASPIFADSRVSCSRFSVEPTAQFSFLAATGIVVTEFASGSGFLIGKDIMVTNAHNLVKMTGQESNVVYFLPSSVAVRYGKVLPSAEVYRGHILLMGDYLNNPVSEDWACIKLENPVESQIEYLKYAKTTYHRGQAMYVGGFQDNCSTPERNRLVYSGCRTDVPVDLNLKNNTRFNGFRIDTSGITTFYGCPLNPGSSGSPALNSNNEVIGVASIGEKSPSPVPTGAFVNVSKFRKCFELAGQK